MVLRRPHQGQRKVIAEARRFNVVDCGRRFGKTVLGIDRLVQPAIAGYPVGWFSPTYKMLSDVWRETRQTLQPVTVRADAQEHRLELVTGGVVDMWSLDQPDAARGRRYKRVVVDEAAMVAGLGEAWTAVIRPTLTDFEGDGWFLSTPKGRNFFWTIYQRGQDATYPEWASWQMPTLANPHIKPSEVEAARHELPERIFAQEYLATFLEDSGGVFRRVTEAATAVPQERGIPGHTYVCGVDFGRTNDYTVISVIDASTGEMVAVDRFSQIDFLIQRARLKALWERFDGQIIAEDNTFGLNVVEDMQRDQLPVYPFHTTNASKLALIDGLALAFEQGALRILPDPTLIAELQAYEQERLPSGLLRFSAPEGQHDDMVMSLALAWYGASMSPTGGIHV